MIRAWPILVLLPLAGCLTSDPCGTITVPAPTAGSTFTYEGRGPVVTSTTWLEADWSLVDGGKPQSDFFDLTGHQLKVRIADSTKAVAAWKGQMVEAWQVTYWAIRADGKAVPSVDEWLAVADSSIIQNGLRQHAPFDTIRHHGIDFLDDEVPPIFYSGMLWGQSAQHQTSFDASRWKSLGRDAKSADVVTSIDKQKCLLVATLAYQTDQSHGKIVMKFADGNPLPVAYGFPGTEMRQIRYEPGTGPALAPWAPGSLEPAFPMLPWSQAIRDPCCGFATSLQQAIEKAEPAIANWRSTHPNAVLAKIYHGQGAREDVVDGWQLTWSDGVNATRVEVLRNRNPVELPPVTQVFRVQLHPAEPLTIEGGSNPWVPLAQLDRVARHEVGQPIEALECELPSGSCYLGTHNGTNMPRVGQLGGSVFVPGINVRADLGVVTYHQGVRGIGLRPPVPLEPRS
jgi:hypothetical protein